MLNLLIADDEVFTREGIIEQVSWQDLGIAQIEQAYDGINALEIVNDFKPDILLTDVRMPRMDGIQLAFKLKKMYPSLEIIFLSGYSDKEYLKSAIKLKAISYVEKPIDIEELQEAIENATALILKETTISENLKHNIALQLISSDYDFNKISNYFNPQNYSKLIDANFLTMLINVIDFKVDDSQKDVLLTELENICITSGYNSFSGFNNNILIMHIYWDHNKQYLSNRENIYVLCSSLSEHLKKYNKFFIAVGKKIIGIKNVFQSYNSAINALNKCFFYSYNSIIYYTNTVSTAYKLNETIFQNFEEYILKNNEQNIILLLKNLKCNFREHTDTPVNYIKDVYYRLFLHLLKFSSERNSTAYKNDCTNQNIFDYISKSNTIDDIEYYLIEKLQNLLHKNTDPISIIIKYINDNYNDIDLSLSKISENIHFTSAYICTIFKEHTGKTINNYITEYRLEKSMEFLKNKNIKINNIANKVGYTDGNYFTKIFKRKTGLTPSEYRRIFL